ncbi:thermostable hemolysin [Marinobacter zhejiangensis]|uniref:Thermostable hemolysin n=1 Tax=Marinobacter zhejiangensis TaxID=488535 RepID=A0A1I4M7W2_9GAMM|nr:thermostable hemolysin [Marinobacter zhejiangensis]SFL99145.1 Thermostable hemolysin [Marinobacter zhejiangensis]
MFEPIVLSTSCIPESGQVYPSLSCAGRLLCEVEPGSPVAGAVADFIRRRFRQAYDALPTLRIPRLLALTTRHGSLLAAVGVRNAQAEALFLEDYIDQPVEQLIPAISQPERHQIAEIAHLAGVEAGVSRFLFPALTVWLKAQGYQWVAFTGTDQLRNSFQRMGIQIRAIADADPARLADGGRGWGRYYDSHPMVMVANVEEAYVAIKASGFLNRIHPYGPQVQAEEDHYGHIA